MIVIPLLLRCGVSGCWLIRVYLGLTPPRLVPSLLLLSFFCVIQSRLPQAESSPGEVSPGTFFFGILKRLSHSSQLFFQEKKSPRFHGGSLELDPAMICSLSSTPGEGGCQTLGYPWVDPGNLSALTAPHLLFSYPEHRLDTSGLLWFPAKQTSQGSPRPPLYRPTLQPAGLSVSQMPWKGT